jgi:hypothetical protein
MSEINQWHATGDGTTAGQEQQGETVMNNNAPDKIWKMLQLTMTLVSKYLTFEPPDHQQRVAFTLAKFLLADPPRELMERLNVRAGYRSIFMEAYAEAQEILAGGVTVNTAKEQAL